MGVHGTFCQLCGLPTQHDHYVPATNGMLKIYRGSSPQGGHAWDAGERPFRFGPEHEWLKDAVVLPWDEDRVLRGTIEDGALEDVLVFEGGDDGLALHHACWELQGSPGSTGQLTLPHRGTPLPSGDELERLEAFELALKQTVEKDRRAALVVVAIGEGQAEFLCWAQDGQALLPAIRAIPAAAAASIEVKADPSWAMATRAISRHRQ